MARGSGRAGADCSLGKLARLELGAPARCPLIALRSGRVALASGNGRIALLEAGPAELKQVRVLDVHEPLLSPLIEGPEGQLYVTGRRGLYALSSELEVLWYGPPARGWGEVVEGPQLCDLDGDGRVEVAQVFQGERHQRGLCVYDRGGAELLWVELDERALQPLQHARPEPVREANQEARAHAHIHVPPVPGSARKCGVARKRRRSRRAGPL